MKKLIAPLAALCLLAVSCKKNNESNAPGVKEYTQLTPGNYWIYKTFNLGDTSTFAPPPSTDSIYVEKDTLISGKTYHKMQISSTTGLDLEIKYLRDSLDYLVDLKGDIRFAPNDFTSKLFSYYWISPGVGRNRHDSVGLCERMMADKDKVITVPAGIFTTSSFRETWYLHPDNIINGIAVNKRDTRYAAGVGMVSEILPFYIGSTYYQERRLVRYHVQ